METIKSYTDLEQSKKLAEILPLESADMYYREWKRMTEYIRIAHVGSADEKDLPCWSLAALLYALPILDNRSPVIPKTFDGKYRVTYHSTAYEKAIITSDYDNPVDACYEMIMKLHELKML